jgi:hypothetical protein
LSVLLFDAARPCRMSVLYVHASAPCLHAAGLSCKCTLLVRAAYQCYIPMLLTHAACPRCMSMLHVHAACLCCMSMLHALLHVDVFMLHVHAACQYCMSMLREYVAWICTVCGVKMNLNIKSSIKMKMNIADKFVYKLVFYSEVL